MESASDRAGYFAVASSAVLSAFGWFAVDRWVPGDSAGSSVAISFMRTIFTLLPAIVAFMIANRRQRRTHRILAVKLDELRDSLGEFQKIRRIEHELHTMDRLSKVAREAVKNTASSARDLFGAIELVGDDRVKERLVERYRNHTKNVVTVLAAVSEQMEESGRSIQRELTAEDAIHILDREKVNTSKGIEYARELLEQRGIAEGVKQLTFAADQASQLQIELISLKAIAPEAGEPVDRKIDVLGADDNG